MCVLDRWKPYQRIGYDYPTTHSRGRHVPLNQEPGVMRSSDPAEDMILLFGMPRSGTTWIGKVFDSHPQVNYRHEPDSQFRLDNIVPLFADCADTPRFLAALQDYAANKLYRCSPRTCGKQPRFAKLGENALTRQGQQLMLLAAKVTERVSGRRLSWPGSRRGRLTWKSIESLGRLGMLLQAFPASRGIMIVRDPRGYVASVMRGEAQGRFLSSDSIANDWGLFDLLCQTPYAQQTGITLAQLKQAAPEQRLAWLWVLFNQKAMDDIAATKNGRMVRYEDLCAHPARDFQMLFNFCGLTWHPQSQAFIQASTTQSKDDYYSVYKDPLQSANKWQQELSTEQAESVAELVGAHPIGQWYFAPPPLT